MKNLTEESKIFTAAYQLQIVETKIEKHRRGGASSFNPNLFKEWFFIAKFKFNTGSVIEVMLGEPRVEYEQLNTLTPTYNEQNRAKEEAWIEYQKVLEIVKSDRYIYSRSRDYGVTIYGRNEDSPTGVTLIGGCSSIEVIDRIARMFGKCTSLSATEDLRSAR